jgi:hypothetical protein
VIVHVILFQPRESLTADDRAKVLEDLKRAASTIPSVRRFRIGRRITHGVPGYERMMLDDYSFAAIIEFDDKEGLVEYLRHPSHQAIGADFTIAAQRGLAYDYDMDDVRA